MNARALVGAMRLGNCAISAIGVLVGYAIAQSPFNPVPAQTILAAAAAAFFITGAGNAINDFFDSDIDKRLGRGKAKTGEKQILAVFSTILFAAGLGLASTLPVAAFAVAAVVSAMLVVYSALLSRAKFIGNLVVALGTALTLIFGAALTQNAYMAGLPALAAFFANVGREIIKDNEDAKGDFGSKKTIPMIMGFPEMKKAVFLVYMAAIACGTAAFMLRVFHGNIFIVLFAISAVLFLNSFRLFGMKQFRGAQRHSKYAMLAALAAFMAGVL